MAQFRSDTVRRLRIGVLGIVLALTVAACGSVGVSSGPNSSASGITGPTTNPTNSPPQISGAPPSSVIAGNSYSFTPTASDADGDTLAFAITNMPDWASFDAGTGRLTGTPPPASIGTYANISISVSDGQSTVSLPPFSISVVAPLTISGNPQTVVTVGSSYTFQPSTNAPSGTALIFAVANAPAWATFDTNTGTLSGTPTQAGTFVNIVISVSDGTQTSALDAFSISVAIPNPTNQPPTISGQPPISVTAGMAYSFTPSASDPDGDKLTFSVGNRPAWLTFNSATGTLSGTPGAANVGTYAGIIISVSDGTTSAVLPAFSIQVTAALTISGTPPTSVAAGTAYSFQPRTNASAGTKLTFSVQNQPAWASFSASTGTMSGTPSSSEVATYSNIVISVTDGAQTSSLPAFSIKVTASLSISGSPPTQVTAGTAYSFRPTTNASGTTALTFSIQNQPSWATFSSSTGTLSGTPSSGQVATYSNVVISVTDGTQTSSLPAFSIKVVAANNLAISGTPSNAVNVGSAYSFTPTVTNPGGGTLTFSIQNKPSWASFNSSNGQLAGTPAATNAGTYSNIVISVTDGTQNSSLPAFSIKVTASLTISGNPPTQITAGTVYSFRPTTNASGATVLTFSIQNQPSWATFSSSTGALSGTPSSSQVATYSNIVIGVTDGVQTSTLPAFSIKVVAANNLTISGTPSGAVNVGSAYTFTPTVTNPGGAALTFGIQNKPSWASFNTSNGQLAGTPAAASAGTYSNIVISVTDGTNNASLPAFAITVNQVANGTATLNWTSVTQNTNGSTLTNLAGYHVHYGTSAGNLSQTAQIANPTVTTYVVTNLSPGTWYFGVSAYTSSGMEGNLSNVGQKTIP
jgi:hypothetical protein